MLSNHSDDGSTVDLVSPVTLSGEWSRLARLILLASLASIGSIGNVFMISAVMIEDYLRKRGNTFVVNVALADFLVSGLVVPSSAVVILAEMHNNLAVCRFQWFLAALCVMVTLLSHAAIAVENFFRLCFSATFYEKLTTGKITAVLILLWTVCSITSSLQFAPDLSFDYCTRKTPGLLSYQATVAAALVFLPLILSILCYTTALLRLRQTRRRAYKAPITFKWDYSLMLTNLYSFLFFVVFWLPFGVVLMVNSLHKVNDGVFYNLAWLGISKSCVNSILYCITNRHFRGAYVNLFHYCCCKTTVSFSRRQRPEGLRPSGDVRVHIIPGYNMYCSPQRARDGQGKRTAARSNGRDVYEL